MTRATKLALLAALSWSGAALSSAATTTLTFSPAGAEVYDMYVEVVPENGDTLGLAGYSFAARGMGVHAINKGLRRHP